MAKWKQLGAHYLNVPGVEWEYNETDRVTGRPVRTRFPVPMYLDPKDPSVWTIKHSPDEGDIIVCHGVPTGKEWQFTGNPTPDMLPLDDEATAISAKFEPIWKHRPDEANPGAFTQSLIDQFQIKMAEIESTPKQVEISGMGEMLTAMTQMMKQNQELLHTVASTRRNISA